MTDVSQPDVSKGMEDDVETEIEDMNPEGKELVLDAFHLLLDGAPHMAAESIAELNDLEIVTAENAVKKLLQIIGEEFTRR